MVDTVDLTEELQSILEWLALLNRKANSLKRSKSYDDKTVSQIILCLKNLEYEIRVSLK